MLFNQFQQSLSKSSIYCTQNVLTLNCNMNDPVFFITQATTFVYVACMRCFLISGSKKATMQFFWI